LTRCENAPTRPYFGARFKFDHRLRSRRSAIKG
jgi:hypothetical protein